MMDTSLCRWVLWEQIQEEITIYLAPNSILYHTEIYETGITSLQWLLMISVHMNLATSNLAKVGGPCSPGRSLTRIPSVSPYFPLTLSSLLPWPTLLIWHSQVALFSDLLSASSHPSLTWKYIPLLKCSVHLHCGSIDITFPSLWSSLSVTH